MARLSSPSARHPAAYQISVDGKQVAALSRLGLEVKDGLKLGEGGFEMHIVAETTESVTRPTAIEESNRKMTAKDRVKTVTAPADGFAAIIRPQVSAKPNAP
jgi:hypothetical protein